MQKSTYNWPDIPITTTTIFAIQKVKPANKVLDKKVLDVSISAIDIVIFAL